MATEIKLWRSKDGNLFASKEEAEEYERHRDILKFIEYERPYFDGIAGSLGFKRLQYHAKEGTIAYASTTKDGCLLSKNEGSLLIRPDGNKITISAMNFKASRNGSVSLTPDYKSPRSIIVDKYNRAFAYVLGKAHFERKF